MGVSESVRSDVPNLMKDVPNFVKDVPRVPNAFRGEDRFAITFLWVPK